MAMKRKTYSFRQGDVIDVEEFHDGRYGAPGEKRQKRKKPTKEEMQKVNAMNKARRARQRMLQYFDAGDCFCTWTYEVSKRPAGMVEALDHFQKAMRIVRREFKKRGYELFWIRNIEQGTKGAWHIHILVNEIGDTAAILKKAWKHGSTTCIEVKLSDKLHDEDFTKLSNYMTKDENTVYLKENGEPGKPRIKEANYNTSRNMPLPDPDVDKLKRWKRSPKPKKGYYIAAMHEGINPVTRYKYRRYTMIRLNRRI